MASSIDGSGVSWPMALRGDLVGRDAREGVHALRGLRPNAAQPRRRAQRVNGGRVGRPVMQAADDAEALAERLERALIGLNSKLLPAVSGVKSFMTIPCGT